MSSGNNQHSYLKKYFNYQDKIVLVSRDTDKSWWGNRVNFLDEDYNRGLYKHYNHRLILDNEIVIEYDNPNKEDNLRYIKIVEKQIKKDKQLYALWYSGGKSYHLHILVDMKNCLNKRLLKKSYMRYYGTLYTNVNNKIIQYGEYILLSQEEKDKYIRILPDLRMSDNNHLIRAEYGLHETTGNKKRLLRRSVGYGVELSTITTGVWQQYSNSLSTVVKRKINNDLSEIIESPEIRTLLSTTEFREAGDGKKRALFILINILKKNKYNIKGKYDNKIELIDYLWEWYRYVGGYHYNKNTIKGMVNYYWDKDYSRMSIKYIQEVLEEIGVKL